MSLAAKRLMKGIKAGQVIDGDEFFSVPEPLRQSNLWPFFAHARASVRSIPVGYE